MGSENDKRYGMKVLFDGTDPTVDVVAVHGLDGHPELTWTAKNGALWLRDYLPEKIPNLRILSYGYDGRTNGSGFSCQNLYDHAIGLVTELTLYRNRTKTNERPIIFIAHDIGGLIVKDALIHSNSTNETNLEHHHTIKTCTYGILFLGTPHQGSDILASLKKKNQTISMNLKENSELLQRQLGQYNSISSKFVTKCFYETNKSQSRKEATIGASAARIPGATNVEVYSINSDHEGMVKYNSAENDGYNKVSGCLKLMVDDAPEKVLEKLNQRNRIKAARMNGVQITFEIPFEPEYPRNQHFTGRKDLLDKLHHTIRAEEPGLVTVVLYGTGGIGKTQIASEYVHAHQKEYDSIFWISCVTKESIQRGFREVAQRLVVEHANIAYDTSPNYAVIAKHLNMSGVVDENGLVSTSEDHIQYIIRGINLWLTKEGNKNWLLIFDNVDDPKNTDIKTFLPAAPDGTVIITSRRTECRLFGTALLVEEMQEQEAQDLLLKSAALTEDPTAGDVVRKLGSLPLAIVQAGAYVAMCEISFTRYLEIYEKYFNRIFTENPPTSHYGDRTVLTTWEISYQAIEETDKGAAELLSLCSFLSNEDICDDMIRWGKGLEKDDITLNSQLGLLFSYSLAQRKGHFDSFSIHPVVHLWAHERLNDLNRVWNTKGALKTFTVAVWDSNLTSMEKINFERRSLQHTMIIAKNVMRYLTGLRRLMDQSLIHRMTMLGLVLSGRGQLREAQEIQLTALEEAKDILGKEHLYTLLAMNNLASTYVYQGQHKEAEVLQLEVLRESQRILGKEHPNTLKTMNNLAITYMNQGQYKEAEVLQLEGLQVSQRILGKEHPDTITSMNNLASIYTNQGQYKEAEVLELEALQVSQRILGKEHPHTITTMNNLASSYNHQGRYKEAEVLQLETLEVSQRILGKEHPDTIARMNNLASTYNQQGRYKRAEVLHLEALELSQRILGKKHPDTIARINNLASTYSNQGQHKKAEVLQLETLEVLQRMLGKEHPRTIRHMDNLTSTYMHQGRYKEAEVLQLEAIEISQRVLGEMNPITLQLTANLAAFQRKASITRHLLGQSDTLIVEQDDVMLKRAIEMSLQSDRPEEGSGGEPLGKNDPFTNINKLAATLGENHPMTLFAMSSLATTFCEKELCQEAEKLQLVVIDRMQENLGNEHKNTLQSKLGLAGNYIQQDRYNEAEALLLPTVEGMQHTLGRDHEDTIFAMKALAVVYNAQGRRKEAMELVEKIRNTDLELVEEAIRLSLCSESSAAGGSKGERKLDKKEPDTLKTMANKAATYWDLGEWEEAERLELKVTNSRGMILGKEDASTLLSMTSLAATYREQERWKDAEALELQVMESRMKSLGNKHLDTLEAMSNLAGTYTDQKRWDEAGELYTKVARARMESLGREDPRTLSAMAALATNHWHKGELDKAEKLELKVVESRRRIFGNDNPDTITAVGNLAATYASQDRYDEAEELQEEVLGLLVKTRGSKYFETVLARELVQLYHEGRMREQLQQQAAARVFSRAPNMAISFVIIFLFICSFLISFSCRLFSYFISCFLPTFQLPMWSYEGIIETLRERVTGMVWLEKYTKDERSGKWVRER